MVEVYSFCMRVPGICFPAAILYSECYSTHLDIARYASSCPQPIPVYSTKNMRHACTLSTHRKHANKNGGVFRSSFLYSRFPLPIGFWASRCLLQVDLGVENSSTQSVSQSIKLICLPYFVILIIMMVYLALTSTLGRLLHLSSSVVRSCKCIRCISRRKVCWDTWRQ